MNRELDYYTYTLHFYVDQYWPTFCNSLNGKLEILSVPDQHCGLIKWVGWKLFYSSIKYFIFTDSSAAGEQTARLCGEAVQVGETLVPQLQRHVANVGHEAEGGERRVEEQREQTPLVCLVLEGGGQVLRGHQHH